MPASILAGHVAGLLFEMAARPQPFGRGMRMEHTSAPAGCSILNVEVIGPGPGLGGPDQARRGCGPIGLIP